MIGYRYVFQGADTIGEMTGTPEHVAGTISAAVVTGMHMSILEAAAIIALVLLLTCSMLIVMKFLHVHLRYKTCKIDRYFDIVGRLAALIIGTIAVDMIVTGVKG